MTPQLNEPAHHIVNDSRAIRLPLNDNGLIFIATALAEANVVGRVFQVIPSPLQVPSYAPVNKEVALQPPYHHALEFVPVVWGENSALWVRECRD